MNNASLSALLDGQCQGPELDQLLEEMDRDPELAEQWSRLCMTREAQSGARFDSNLPCICAGVMAQLDDAPVEGGDTVVPFARPETPAPAVQSGVRKRYWKPVVGFAAAASMGAAAVLLIQPQATTQQEFESPATATVASAEPLQWTGSSAPQSTQVASNDDEAHSQMLREYLMDHSNAVSGEGVGGTLRYARFAAHTAEYQPYPGEFR